MFWGGWEVFLGSRFWEIGNGHPVVANSIVLCMCLGASGSKYLEASPCFQSPPSFENQLHCEQRMI